MDLNLVFESEKGLAKIILVSEFAYFYLFIIVLLNWFYLFRTANACVF